MTGGKDKGAAGAGCGGRRSAPDMPPAPLPGPRVTRGDQTRGRGSCRAPGSLPLPSTWGLGERGPRVFINPARRCRCCRRLPPDARRETGAREGNLCSPVPPLRDQTGLGLGGSPTPRRLPRAAPCTSPRRLRSAGPGKSPVVAWGGGRAPHPVAGTAGPFLPREAAWPTPSHPAGAWAVCRGGVRGHIGGGKGRVGGLWRRPD